METVNEGREADMMTLDASAVIGLVSLVATLMGAAFWVGVRFGRQNEKIERLTRKLEEEEHRDAHKNDRR